MRVNLPIVDFCSGFFRGASEAMMSLGWLMIVHHGRDVMHSFSEGNGLLPPSSSSPTRVCDRISRHRFHVKN